MCASLDQCNIPGFWGKKKSCPISKEFAKFGIFNGKMWHIFFVCVWQNLAIFVTKFVISNGNFPRCQGIDYVRHSRLRLGTL